MENLLLACVALDRRRLTWLRALSSYADLMDRASSLLDRFDLSSLKDMSAKHLSYGDQRRLEVALSLAGHPRLLLLDEPMAGLSTPERVAMRSLLETLDPAMAVLLIEHDMDMAFSFAERVTVLHQGRVLAEGSRDEVERERDGAADLPGLGRERAAVDEALTCSTWLDLHTYYGDSHVLQGVTLRAERGTVTAVLGRNGVGQDDALPLAHGPHASAQRTRVFDGVDTTRLPPHRIRETGISLVPQGRRIFTSLTVTENLAIAGAARRARRVARARIATARGPSIASSRSFPGSPSAVTTAEAS